MPRLCFGSRRNAIYSAMGKVVYGFSRSGTEVQNTATFPRFKDDVRVLEEGPEGLLIVASGVDLHVLDTRSVGRVACEVWSAHTATICTAQYNSSVGLLFSAGRDKAIGVWRIEADTLTEVGRIRDAHDDWILAVHMDTEHGILLSAGMDGVLKAWWLDGIRLTPLAKSSVSSAGLIALQYHSVDGSVLCVSQDGTVGVHQLELGALIEKCTVPEAHDGWGKALQFDGASGIAVSAGDDGSVRAWQLTEESGELLKIYEAEYAHDEGASALCFHAASRTVVSAGNKGELIIWRLEESELVYTFVKEGAHSGVVSAMQLDATSETLLSAGSDGAIKVWRLTLNAPVNEVELSLVTQSAQGCHAGVLALQFAADRGNLLSAGVDGTIILWKLLLGALTPSPPARAHSGQIFALHYHVAASIVVSSGADKMIRVWSLQDDCLSLQSSTPEPLGQAALAIQFDAASNTLLSGGMGEMRVWALAAGGEIRPIPLTPRAGASTGFGDGVLALQYDVVRQIALSLGVDGALKAWQLKVSTFVAKFPAVKAHEGWTRDIRFHGPSGIAASAGDDGAIRVWRLDEDAFVLIGEAGQAHPDGVRGVLYDPDSRTVFSLGDNGMIRLWKAEAPSITLLSVAQAAHSAAILALQKVSGHPQLGTLVSAGMDGSIKSWCLEDEQLIPCVTVDGSDPILALHHISEVQLLVTGGMSGTLRVWSLDGGGMQLAAEAAEAHWGHVRVVCLCSATAMISAGEDGSIKVWNIALAEGVLELLVAVEEAHMGYGVYTLLYDENKNLLFSGGDDGALRAWHCDPLNSRLERIADALSAHPTTVKVVRRLASQPYTASSPSSAEEDEEEILLLSGGARGILRVWRFARNEFSSLGRTAAHQGGVLALDIASDLELIISSGGDGAIRLWRWTDTALQPIVSAAVGGRTMAVQLDSASGILFSAGGDKAISTSRLTSGGLFPLTSAMGTNHQVFRICLGSSSSQRFS